jgi:hypothetical protein
MPNNIVRFISKLVPGIAGDALKHTVGPLDATLQIRGGKEQFLRAEMARLVNRFNQRKYSQPLVTTQSYRG